jgi:predicted permease
VDRLRELLRRFWYLLNRRRLEAELRAEMAAHRALMDDPRRFGNTLRLREEARRVWGWTWWTDLARDLGTGVRTLRRSPGFTVAAVLVLSLGIGLNLALFQVVSAALIRPPAVKDPHSLVTLHHRSPTSYSSTVPLPVANAVRRHNTVLAAVLVSRVETAGWGNPAERASAAFVSSNWFDQIGATSAAGRLFRETVDAAPGAPPAAVLSHAFWQRRLGGDPNVVGTVVPINGQPTVLLGVAGANVRGLDGEAADVWLPIEQAAVFRGGRQFDDGVRMYARLREGVSWPAADASLRVTMDGIAATAPDLVKPGGWLEGYSALDRFNPPHERQQAWRIVSGIAAMTMLVLLIACLNLGNLTLARSIARIREMSIRMALGASRWRIARLLVAEYAWLAAAGALGGLALSSAVLAWIVARVENAAVDVTVDWRVLTVTAATALVALAAVSVAPALKIGRRDLALATRDGGERVSQGLHASRLRHWLVGLQVAGSCALLVVAGQTLRGLQQALADERGFGFERVAVLDPALDSFGLTEETEVAAFWDRARAVVAGHPETVQIALVDSTPPTTMTRSATYAVAPNVRFHVLGVAADFFATLQIPLLAGRTFSPGERHDDAVIVSRRGALGLYGTLDVIGRSFPSGNGPPFVVGIVEDVRLTVLQSVEMAEAYRPLQPSEATAMLVRARTDPSLLLPALRAAAHGTDARVAPDVRLMRDDFNRAMQPTRLVSGVTTTTALLALALVCVGLCGVVSYSAGVRRREVGIRLALGARPRHAVRVLLRHSLTPGALGVVAGLAAGWLLGRAFAGAPFHLRPLDPAAYAAVTTLLLAATSGSALLPVWRTLREDPLRALRHE